MKSQHGRAVGSAASGRRQGVCIGAVSSASIQARARSKEGSLLGLDRRRYKSRYEEEGILFNIFTELPMFPLAVLHGILASRSIQLQRFLHSDLVIWQPTLSFMAGLQFEKAIELSSRHNEGAYGSRLMNYVF